MSKTLPLVAEGQILIDVKKYVDDVLGKSQQVDEDNYLNDSDYQSIPYDRAEAILAVCQNRHTCYIQMPSEDCPELKLPLLWNYNAWLQSVEKFRLEKERSHRRRVAMWLQEANVKTLQRAILKQMPLTEVQAGVMASRWIRENRQDMITFFKIILKTKEEEL